jgi:hypothetical protein
VHWLADEANLRVDLWLLRERGTAMSLSSTMLREDQTIVFRCLGKDVQESHQFVKGSFFRPLHVHHGTASSELNLVELVGTRTEEGTEWIVHETANPGVFTFECAGTGLFLNGQTLACKVNLGRKGEIGTAWKVSDLPEPGQIHVTLQCQGDQGQRPQQCPFGFLNGHTADGVVDLANATDEPFSGTHWELIVFEPVVGEGGGGGDPSGVPHKDL